MSPATTEIYTLSLHDALPISRSRKEKVRAELPDALDLLAVSVEAGMGFDGAITKLTEHMDGALSEELDRKSTRLNSSHEWISYAVFCLKKKKKNTRAPIPHRP